MLNVYLLRHGETEYNAQNNRYCGLSDIDLTEKGTAQALLVRNQLKDIEVAAVYSSPLKRAQVTATLATGHTPTTDQRLIEADFGLWEGKTKEEFIPEHPKLWDAWNEDPAHSKAGGTGESGLTIVNRMVDFFEYARMRHQNSNIVVVAHNGVNRLYLAHMLGMPLKNYRQLVIENSCLCHFSLCELGKLSLHKLNSKG